MSIGMSENKLWERLSQETRAEVRFDKGSRLLYSTDASLYQIEPIGVLVPRTIKDVSQAIRIAAEEGIPIVARGAATSLSGQTVGKGLVIDFTKYLNRIGVVDRDRMTVRVEPGVVLDQLTARLKPLGLMFGPDVSTSDRATIGGMIGNNSAGARSLRFGKTVDHIKAMDVVLDDGSTSTFRSLDESDLEILCSQNDRTGLLHREVRELVFEHREAIATHFPRILRRVSGYNLDEFIPGLPVRPEDWPEEPWSFNLSKLIVGSEGTLAVVVGAEARVMPAPKAQGLVLLSFSTMQGALERLEEILETGPTAVEMVDRMILDLASRNPEYARFLDFADGLPAAVLAAQYYSDSPEELAERAERLARMFQGKPGVLGVRKRLENSAKDSFWKVRKAGVSLLMGKVGDEKPVAFVEDTAVSSDRLPEFHARFQDVLTRNGTVGACYGHADVGCLHIRPVLNMKTAEGVDRLRSIAREISDLVLEFGGAMSGEHGDGLARSVWNPKLFGPEVYSAFERVKRAFDPRDLLNPGKVVGGPDPGDNLRIGPLYQVREPESTVFDFSKQGGFARAVELCSGVGACRKTDTGTMCPSYMITRDEQHSTRGRANALRLVLTGELPAIGLDEPTLADALDLCLQCKACKTECPSNVDLAKLKAEWLHQTQTANGVPFGHRLLGHVHVLNRLGSATAPLANWTSRNPLFKRFLEKVAGIDKRRDLPRFAWTPFREWFRRHVPDRRSGTRGEVVLIEDCFTNYNAPSVAIAGTKVLEAAGYRVVLSGIECCGRAAISKGLLDLARKMAKTNVEKLATYAERGVAIVGCEPSCVLTLADEYRDFRLGVKGDIVAGAARLIDDFLADPDRVKNLPLKSLNAKAILHGHCHQKALVGTAGTVASLKRIPDLDLRELDSGCCGMAGSFGYEVGHYDISKALAERVLLPSALAEPDSILLAPGFSCRSQVHDLAGINAIHPVELLARQLQET